MSNFINKSDYYHRIQQARLEAIIQREDNLIEEAEETAIQVVRDALHNYYKVDEIFASSGADRPRNVLRWTTSLVLYYLYERIPDKLVPDRVIKNYNDTLKILHEIADGKRSVELPRLEGDEGEIISKFRWGSEIRRDHG